MITRDEIKLLLGRAAAPEGRVLSVYLNFQSSGDAALHRRFESEFKTIIQHLWWETASSESDRLKKDIEKAQHFLAAFEPAGKALAVFSDAASDFFWAKELNVHIPSQAFWGPKPRVRPLLEALDEHERYCIVLADRERARLFTYALGQIEEEKGAFAPNDVSHFRSSGKDNLRSAFKLQRTAELHEAWHLRHVVSLIEEMAARKPFNRVILGGAKEAADELYGMLSPRLREEVCGRITAGIETHERALLDSVNALEVNIERQAELDLVRQLLETETSADRSALGLQAALNHVNYETARKLVYSDTLNIKGSICPLCGHMFLESRLMCGRCDAVLNPVQDLLEEMATRVITAGGAIEQVRGDAARLLDSAGGVAVLVKKERI